MCVCVCEREREIESGVERERKIGRRERESLREIGEGERKSDLF